MTRERRTVPIPLTITRFSTSPLAIDEGCCPFCDVYLAHHQPDADRPDRLLSICEKCGRWYLIDVVPEADEALMILLPEPEAFRDALGS